MEPVISVKEVSFTGQNVRVISNISIDLEPGKTTALAGASGCGKSTLLKICAGLLIPSDGEVWYKGKDIAMMTDRQNANFRKESAFVFQDSALWANQSLYQNLELPLRLHRPELSKEERRARIGAVCAEVGYRRSLELRPAALSMGEQKLIAFARALICEPNLLFLDEWTESLDDSAANRLLSLVKQRQAGNTTIVFVSHKLGILRSLAHNIVLLTEGSVRLIVTAEQIKEDADLAEMLEKGIE